MWPGLLLSFFLLYLFFSRPRCLGLLMKNRVKSVFFEVMNSSATSMCSIRQLLLQCLHAHIRWESTHIGSRTCSIGFIFSYKIIVRVIYGGVFKETLTKQLYCSRSEATVFWGPLWRRNSSHSEIWFLLSTCASLYCSHAKPIIEDFHELK